MPPRPGAPCLREDIAIIQQVYRGETSFVVKDLAAGRYFRFGAAEVRVLRAFDGQRTPDEIAAALAGDGMRISPQVVESFTRTLPYVDWMFGRTFVLASLGLFVLYGALLGARWDEFGAALASTYSLQT